jgi:hypothetical protein
MPWTGDRGSGIFRQWMADALSQAANFGGSWGTPAVPPADGDFLVALFKTAVTPDKNAARPATAYGGGVWTPTNQQAPADVANWPLIGVPLTDVEVVEAVLNGITLPPPAGGGPAPTADYAGLITVFGPPAGTPNNNAGGGGTVTLDDISGDLVYWADPATNTIQAGQGVAHHWFGGPNQVTDGTFTIIWHPTAGMLVQAV